MGKKIYLTESELQRIVENATIEVINENQQNEFLGTALALGGLATAAGLYGKRKAQGYHPLKNAFRRVKSAINGTEYQSVEGVDKPDSMRTPDDIKKFQSEHINSYKDGSNIVVGKWGPYEQKIWNSQMNGQNNEVEF